MNFHYVCILIHINKYILLSYILKFNDFSYAFQIHKIVWFTNELNLKMNWNDCGEMIFGTLRAMRVLTLVVCFGVGCFILTVWSGIRCHLYFVWSGIRCHFLVVCSGIGRSIMRNGLDGDFSVMLRLLYIAPTQ